MKEIRRSGLLIAVSLNQCVDIREIIDCCIKNKVIVGEFLFDRNSFKIAPPFIITEQEIMESSRIIRDCLDTFVL